MVNLGVATAGFGFKVSLWLLMGIVAGLVLFGYTLGDQKGKEHFKTW